MPMKPADFKDLRETQRKVQQAYDDYEKLKKELEGVKAGEEVPHMSNYAEIHQHDKEYQKSIKLLLAKRQALLNISKTLNTKIAKFQHYNANTSELLSKVGAILEKPPINKTIALSEMLQVNYVEKGTIITSQARGEQDPEVIENVGGYWKEKERKFLSSLSRNKNDRLQAEGQSFSEVLKSTAKTIKDQQLNAILDNCSSTGESGLKAQYLKAKKSDPNSIEVQARLVQIELIRKDLELINTNKPSEGNKQENDLKLAGLIRGCLLTHKEALNINLRSTLGDLLTGLLNLEAIKSDYKDPKSLYRGWLAETPRSDAVAADALAGKPVNVSEAKPAEVGTGKPTDKTYSESKTAEFNDLFPDIQVPKGVTPPTSESEVKPAEAKGRSARADIAPADSVYNILDNLRGLRAEYLTDKSLTEAKAGKANKATLDRISKIQEELESIYANRPKTKDTKQDSLQLAALVRGCLVKHRNDIGIAWNSSLKNILKKYIDSEALKISKVDAATARSLESKGVLEGEFKPRLKTKGKGLASPSLASIPEDEPEGEPVAQVLEEASDEEPSEARVFTVDLGENPELEELRKALDEYNKQYKQINARTLGDDNLRLTPLIELLQARTNLEKASEILLKKAEKVPEEYALLKYALLKDVGAVLAKNPINDDKKLRTQDLVVKDNDESGKQIVTGKMERDRYPKEKFQKRITDLPEGVEVDEELSVRLVEKGFGRRENSEYGEAGKNFQLRLQQAIDLTKKEEKTLQEQARTARDRSYWTEMLDESEGREALNIKETYLAKKTANNKDINPARVLQIEHVMADLQSIDELPAIVPEEDRTVYRKACLDNHIAVLKEDGGSRGDLNAILTDMLKRLPNVALIEQIKNVRFNFKEPAVQQEAYRRFLTTLDSRPFSGQDIYLGKQKEKAREEKANTDMDKNYWAEMLNDSSEDGEALNIKEKYLAKKTGTKDKNPARELQIDRVMADLQLIETLQGVPEEDKALFRKACLDNHIAVLKEDGGSRGVLNGILTGMLKRLPNASMIKEKAPAAQQQAYRELLKAKGSVPFSKLDILSNSVTAKQVDYAKLLDKVNKSDWSTGKNFGQTKEHWPLNRKVDAERLEKLHSELVVSSSKLHEAMLRQPDKLSHEHANALDKALSSLTTRIEPTSAQYINYTLKNTPLATAGGSYDSAGPGLNLKIQVESTKAYLEANIAAVKVPKDTALQKMLENYSQPEVLEGAYRAKKFPVITPSFPQSSFSKHKADTHPKEISLEREQDMLKISADLAAIKEMSKQRKESDGQLQYTEDTIKAIVRGCLLTHKEKLGHTLIGTNSSLDKVLKDMLNNKEIKPPNPARGQDKSDKAIYQGVSTQIAEFKLKAPGQASVAPDQGVSSARRKPMNVP